MTEMKLKIITQDRAWNGYCKIDVYRLQHDRLDGAQSPILEREVL